MKGESKAIENILEDLEGFSVLDAEYIIKKALTKIKRKAVYKTK